MHRRILFPALALLLTTATANARENQKTNVILIMADDIGYECHEPYGSTSYRTPVLNRLAAAGMRFDHCYSNPSCTPTRVKLMTGLYNVRNYVAFSMMRKNEKTIGHMMRQAGYRTAIAGKWQLLGSEVLDDEVRLKGTWPKDAGFERHCLWQVYKMGQRYWGPMVTIDESIKRYPKDVYGPDVYCQFLLDRMEEYKDEPFFLYYPMALVHWEPVGKFQPTPDTVDRNSTNQQENFADMVAYMDKLIGRIVDKTVELGIAEQTLILVTGDNGTYQSIKSNIGDKIVVGGKGESADAGTHVALFAYQPGTVPAGKVSKTLVDFSDFAPTIAEATGARPLLPTDGQSFLPQLHGKQGNLRKYLFSYVGRRVGTTGPPRFVRNQRWKLYSDGRLIDVQNDVLEQSPVVGPQTDVIRQELQAAMDRMSSKLQSHMKFD